MSGNSATRHISGRLKQSNKRHNKIGHSSKRAVDRKLAGGGRVEAKLKRTLQKPGRNGRNRSKFGDKQRDGSVQRTNRLNRARQIANERRKNMVLKRRLEAGSSDGAPKMICIVGLDDDADAMAFQVRSLILSQAEGTKVHDSKAAPGFVSTYASPRWKQRFSVITPPSSDSVAVLDAAKVCDVLVVVVKASAEGTYTNNVGIDTLCCIRAQGTPAVVGVQSGMGKVAPKQRSAAKKLGSRFFAAELGEDNFKLVDFDVDLLEIGQPGVMARSSSTSQLCRTIGECPGKKLTLQKHRSYLIADEARLEGSDLHVTGFIRGSPLWVNSLIHVTGVGTYQLRQIEDAVDPVPLKGSSRGKKQVSASNSNVAGNLLLKADLSLQEDLDQLAQPDQLAGEQSFISDAELLEADSRFSQQQVGAPGAAAAPTESMSIHQAWIAAAKEGAAMAGEAFSGNGSIMMGDDSDADDPVLGALDGRGVPIDQAAKDLMGATASSISTGARMNLDGDEEEEEEEDDDDQNKSAAQVRAEAQALRQQRRKEMQDEDVKFPDEVDTPLDMPARVRFAKYRGLKSFRSSPWDPKESLPADYARIFQLANFTLSQKRAIKAAQAVNDAYEKRIMNSMEMQRRTIKEKKRKQKEDKLNKASIMSNVNVGYVGEDAVMGMDGEDMDSEMNDRDDEYSGLKPMEILANSVVPGRFVRLILANVSSDSLSNHPPHSPLILSSLMAHENRTTVMNFLVQKSTVTCEDAVKSKDPLDVMCGFRRILGSRAVFSQHNINSDKHKFERFLQPGRFTCASAYFPVSYGQAPTLFMKTMPNGSKQLVASG